MFKNILPTFEVVLYFILRFYECLACAINLLSWNPVSRLMYGMISNYFGEY